MKLEHARKMAESLRTDLEPYCERIEIGGSIRRKKPEVKDIELVCIPKFVEVGTGQTSLFGGEATISVNQLFQMMAVPGRRVLKMGGRYAQIEVLNRVKNDSFIDVQHIKADIFAVTPETRGYIYLLRTGPAEFSKWIVTELKRRRCTPKDGAGWVDDIPSGQIRADIASENAMFHLLGIDYIEPEDRGRVI